jgi:hypothetical protein
LRGREGMTIKQNWGNSFQSVKSICFGDFWRGGAGVAADPLFTKFQNSKVLSSLIVYPQTKLWVTKQAWSAVVQQMSYLVTESSKTPREKQFQSTALLTNNGTLHYVTIHNRRNQRHEIVNKEE